MWTKFSSVADPDAIYKKKSGSDKTKIFFFVFLFLHCLKYLRYIFIHFLYLEIKPDSHFPKGSDPCYFIRWFLTTCYALVNIKGIFEFIFYLNKCLKQIKILSSLNMCTSISNIPPSISTMVGSGFLVFKDTDPQH